MWGINKHLPEESWGRKGEKILNYTQKSLEEAEERFKKSNSEADRKKVEEIREFLAKNKK